MSDEQETPLTEDQLDEIETRIDAWLGRAVSELDVVAAFERADDAPRFWYVRMQGEEKENFSIELVLAQRTLTYRSYFMPAPEENLSAVFEQLMRRNDRLYGLAYGIGGDNGVYLRGQLGSRHVDDAALDRIIGSIWMATEEAFVAAMRLGFASRFKR